MTDTAELDKLCEPLRASDPARWNAAKGRFLKEVAALELRAEKDRRPSPAIRIYERSDSPECRSEMEARLRTAHRLVMIGMGLNVLKPRELQDALVRRAAVGECSIEIFLGDVAAPGVQSRLIEEELPLPGHTHSAGLEPNEFFGYIDSLHPQNSIRCNYFSHYPTYALIIADCDYFTYPYGYATLGNYSPVLVFSQLNPEHKPFVAFFDSQVEKIREAAYDHRLAGDFRNERAEPVPLDAERLHALAVYFIPSEGSGLYRCGSNLLGHDVRAGRFFQGELPEGVVGAARNFGFHVTVADALWLPNKAEAAKAATEVAWVARRLEPFVLSDLKVKAKTPDPKSIAITAAKDRSGTLEALHNELVHRVYRRSLASAYSLGLSPLSRDGMTQRARLMLKWYRAPYVLGEFKPHFTVCANVQSAAMEAEVCGVVEQRLRALGPEPVVFDRVCVMQQKSGIWSIAEEIKLGR